MIATPERKTAVAIVAHPDDAELGCGATMAKRVDEGWTVKVIFLSQGGVSRGPGAVNVDEIKANAIAACKVLGVTGVTFLDFPDNQFDSVPQLDITRQIEAFMYSKGFDPAVVFTHHPDDLNIDHRRTFDAVMPAFRPRGNHSAEIYSIYVPSSTEWGNDPFVPNFYEDVATTIDRKLDALACYTTEMREYPHPRSIQAIRNNAMYFGNVINKRYAEPFRLVRGIND
jgi:LmbE family N-acetylglucosaminyl deacetylase